jgi:uncharacterized protein (DUF433 family)
MNWRDYIISDKEVLLGKPTIRGTRISVEHILDLKVSGWSEDQILANYPRLNKEALLSVFMFVQECMQDGLLIFDDRKSA